MRRSWVRARWLSITLATLISHLSLYLVLLVSLRFVGVPDAQVDAELLLAKAVGPLVSAIAWSVLGDYDAVALALAVVAASAIVFFALAIRRRAR